MRPAISPGYFDVLSVWSFNISFCFGGGRSICFVHFKWVKYEAENVEIYFIKTFYSIYFQRRHQEIYLLVNMSVCLSVCLHPINKRAMIKVTRYVLKVNI